MITIFCVRKTTLTKMMVTMAMHRPSEADLLHAVVAVPPLKQGDAGEAALAPCQRIRMTRRPVIQIKLPKINSQRGSDVASKQAVMMTRAR